jgi:PKHD-type hydroxylase
LLRADVSATLFLSDPADYDGGELVVEGEYGAQEVKLAAGDLIVYPSGSLHRVAPVTRGERLAAFLWVQSLVADASSRALLFDLDQAIQALSRTHAPDDPAVLRLTAVYHNLVRRWAQP